MKFDAKSIDCTSHQAFWWSIMIAGEDEAIEARIFILNSFDGAPKNSLTASTVVGVGMEEPDGWLPVPTAVENGRNNSLD